MAQQGTATPTGTPYAGAPQSSESSSGARDAAAEKAGQVKDQAAEKAQQVKSGLRGQVDTRSTEAGERINTQASDVRQVAQSLREQGKEGPAKIAEQAADRVERVGGYLKDQDADAIIGDVERYARSNPWAVVAGGLALGFVASRMLRASADNRSTSGLQDQGARRPALPPVGQTAPVGGQTGTGTYGTPPVGYESPVGTPGTL
jgi:ElaB/YqjD/DUF883 family membrane-anchored ribosome-binding protein